jgi:hypothetical protein
MSYSPEVLEKAHKQSSQHRDRVLAGKCGCFDCLSIYDGDIVKEWIDDGQTAICPICKIDTVLPVSDDVPAGELAFLKAMRDHWTSPES